jgi:uncharacterized protein (TIGR00255 family)
MVNSMTGFGAACGQVQGVEFTVELRSVNNRYLKVSHRLPEGLHVLETPIEAKVRDRIHRGTVSVAVRMKVPDEQAVYRVNRSALNSYLDQLREAELDANPQLRVDLAALLQLPGVCVPPPLEELAEKTADGLLGLLGEALDALERMRQTEGRSIAEDLTTQAERINELLDVIASRTDEVVKLYHERLTQRVGELAAQAKLHLDGETLAREVALFAERSDIAEELSRLRAHLVEFRKLLDGDEAVGRKLDFMAQEMLREANTIASKASDADIARKVVDIKTAIDRIKEQAANVE